LLYSPFFLVAAGVTAAEPAVAQTFNDEGFALNPPAGGDFRGGINAPAVVFVPSTSQFVMYFESPAVSSEIPSACGSAGYYRIGRAVSADGLSWTLDPSAVLTQAQVPGATCGVAQPSALFDGSTWYMVFKVNTATVSTNALALATSSDGVNWSLSGITNLVTRGSASALGDPSLMRLGGVLHLYYTYGADIYAAYSPDDGVTWSFQAAPVLVHNTSDPTQARAINGSSVACDEVTPGGALTLFYYGFDNANAKTFFSASSSDGVAYSTMGQVSITCTSCACTSSAPNHWEIVTTTSGEAIMYYSKNNASGLKAIGLATTSSSALSGSASDRVCDTDDDQDSVVDGMDACPDTVAGAVVDSTGCSVEQYAPCSGEWRNHGAYVRAVVVAARAFLDAGLISQSERSTIVSNAAASSCGQSH
jgi:hypothetical protein